MGEDGEETGIKIPYIVTISEETGKVLAIRRNYIEGDESYKKIQYFVHYKFFRVWASTGWVLSTLLADFLGPPQRRYDS
jgi:hypothetical protein